MVIFKKKIFFKEIFDYGTSEKEENQNWGIRQFFFKTHFIQWNVE